MTKRYALRVELIDGTLEEPFYYMGNKAQAIAFIKTNANASTADDVVRYWVDDTKSEIGIASFPTRIANA